MKETKKEVNWISVPPLRVYSRPNINSTSTRKENINEKYMTHDKVAGRWDGPAAQALRVNLAFSEDLIWFCEATFTGLTMKPILCVVEPLPGWTKTNLKINQFFLPFFLSDWFYEKCIKRIIEDLIE